MWTDDELKEMIGASESHLVERKQSMPKGRDLREALVAFANTVRIGEHAVIFIGVKDDGTVIGVRKTDLDSIQKTITTVALSECTPPVRCEPRVLRVGEAEVLAVVVPPSERRPHFTGHALIRVGSENKKANEEQMNELIASRNDKARRILELKGKRVSIELRPPIRKERWPGEMLIHQREYVVVGCDAHSVTIEDRNYSRTITEPLSCVEVCPERLIGHAGKLIFINPNADQF